jgi:hypothetical protein
MPFERNVCIFILMSINTRPLLLPCRLQFQAAWFSGL